MVFCEDMTTILLFRVVVCLFFLGVMFVCDNIEMLCVVIVCGLFVDFSGKMTVKLAMSQFIVQEKVHSVNN